MSNVSTQLNSEIHYHSNLADIPTFPTFVRYPFGLDSLIKSHPADIRATASPGTNVEPCDGHLVPLTQFFFDPTLREQTDPIPRSDIDELLLDPSTDAFSKASDEQNLQTSTHFLRHTDHVRNTQLSVKKEALSRGYRSIKSEPQNEDTEHDLKTQQFIDAQELLSTPLENIHHPKDSSLRALTVSPLIPSEWVPQLSSLGRPVHVASEDVFDSNNSLIREIDLKQSKDGVKRRRAVGIFHKTNEHFDCTKSLAMDIHSKDQLLLSLLPSGEPVLTKLGSNQVHLTRKQGIPKPSEVGNIRVEH
ncbi:hypothetical protein P9112_007553 [Eukaryota sp. TZLM1-RC]